MKKEKGTFFGIALVTVMVLGCLMAGCDNGTTGSEEGGYLIAGKFASQTGSGDAVFYADYAPAARSVSRAVAGLTATEKELTGKIEDGDIVFNLKGVYDTATKEFFLSAGSSVLIYQVAGTLSSTGAMSNTSAAVKVKSNDDWVIHEVAVSPTEDAEITGNASAEQVEGIPSSWFGLWESDEGMQGIFTEYQLVDPEYPGDPAGLLDTVTVTAGQKYETVWQAYAYTLDQNEVVISKDLTFTRIVIEADGANLKWTLYIDSISDNFTDAKAHGLSGETQSVIVHRPGSGN